MSQSGNWPDLDKLRSEYDGNLDACAMIADVARNKSWIDEAKRVSTTRCTYCGKERGSQLQSCALCKAARYCNEKCQRADYKPRHRRECAEFVHPPRTRSFLTRPVGDEQYPRDPLCARGHNEGIGCWVSARPRVNCELERLVHTICPVVDEAKRRARSKLVCSQMHKMGQGYRRNLCTIIICVQNRRKDNAAVLAFGSRAQLITGASSTDEVLRGRIDDYDNVTTFIRNGQTIAAVGVPTDPWTHKSRVIVCHVNGQDTHEPPCHPGVQDADEGIVALKPGDFAIMAIQFRIGDEYTINRELQALRCLDHIVVPFMLWDRISCPATLAAAIPPAYTLPASGLAAAAEKHQPSSLRRLHMSFDQDAITAYYQDYIEHSEEAFVRTHRGESHLNMSHSVAKKDAALLRIILDHQDVTLEEVINRGREHGLSDFLESSLRAMF